MRILVLALLASSALSGCSSKGEDERNAEAKLAMSPPSPLIAQSAVGQGICRGTEYFYQARKLKDGSLCSNFQWRKINSPSMAWNQDWNEEAHKNYCTDSVKDDCFID